MHTATILANPVDTLSPRDTPLALPNPPLHRPNSNFEVQCNGSVYGRDLNPESCAEVQRRIPTLAGNLRFGLRGRQGVNVATPWRWISCKFSDVRYGKGRAGRYLNPLNVIWLADGLCAIEVAETQQAQGSYLDLATAADEMNQVCVDFSVVPEGSIASNIGKAF